MGDIIFTITGGTHDYDVELIPDIGISWTYGSSGTKTLHDIPAGSYQMKITDANGCMTINEEFIRISECECVPTLTVGYDDPGGNEVYGFGRSGYDMEFSVMGSLSPDCEKIVALFYGVAQNLYLLIEEESCSTSIIIRIDATDYILYFISEQEGVCFYKLESISPYGVSQNNNPYPT